MRSIAIGLCACVVACGAPPKPMTSAPVVTHSTPPTVSTMEEALTRLFTTDSASEDWFARSFLDAIPIAKVDAITQKVRRSGGALKGVHAVDGHWIVDFEHAQWHAEGALDAEHRFTGLWIRPEEPKAASLDEALQDFKSLPGKVSVVVVSDGTERAALEPDAALAVGSTFKLATLAALRTEIEGKTRSWTDVVQLHHDARSLPSGILQDWPDGAPVTVYTLAALMISRSDNTATDALIDLVGRAKIEPFAARNKPYLSTRDMFVLKSNADLLAKYRSGDEAARRAMLKDLRDRPLPKLEKYPSEPTALDVEWFFTVRELCVLMKTVHDLPVMSINPGVASRKDWTSIAYKGGSEPGVINMTTWVEKGSRTHCISATWNAPQKLDETRFESDYRRVLTFLSGS